MTQVIQNEICNRGQIRCPESQKVCSRQTLASIDPLFTDEKTEVRRELHFAQGKRGSKLKPGSKPSLPPKTQNPFSHSCQICSVLLAGTLLVPSTYPPYCHLPQLPSPQLASNHVSSGRKLPHHSGLFHWHFSGIAPCMAVPFPGHMEKYLLLQQAQGLPASFPMQFSLPGRFFPFIFNRQDPLTF